MEAKRTLKPDPTPRTDPAGGVPDFSSEALETCLSVLQIVSEKPELMDQHDRFKSLVTKIHRGAKLQKRKLKRRLIADADRQAFQSSGIVRQRSADPVPPIQDGDSLRRLVKPQNCYCCKTPFTQLHHFYHLLCPACSALNWEKRFQKCDLKNHAALVTGGRIKIGYQTVLKLLRDGASVITTTRFPVDAAKRFQREDDFWQWQDRLKIRALDLRNIPAVEAFADEVVSTLRSLDILIHNAAQTVKRPLAFYRHLLEAEENAAPNSLVPIGATRSVLLETGAAYRGHLSNVEPYFPLGWLDPDGQQIDQRPLHTWLLKLEQVPTLEMLEVYLVNAAAPFVLTSRLKPLLSRSTNGRKFVVNVSAMEGQFAREHKTAFHPHTNMAKAALNMLTRTAAQDFTSANIYMNSVDTGWITDEKPTPVATRVREVYGFHPPLDVIDGASRVYDPIARGRNEAVEPWSGKFLKDYQPCSW